VGERGKSCTPRALGIREPGETVGLEKRSAQCKHSGLLMELNLVFRALK